MNWEAFGALAEMLGALGVIATLWYLANQIREQTRDSRLAATRALSAELRSLQNDLAHNAELHEIFRKGLKGYHSLPDEDKYRHAKLLFQYFGIVEQCYIHGTDSFLDDDYFRATLTGFRELLEFDGVIEWWNASKDRYHQKFRDSIDLMINERVEVPPKQSLETDA